MIKVLAVVDISNLYYSIKTRFGPDARLDYQKLMNRIREYGEVYRAIAYGAAIGSQADKFKEVLRGTGFEPRYKEPRSYPDPENHGREFRKADWDVGMAMDVVRILDSVDTVVFCTADGDLAPCLEYVESKGKRPMVIGCKLSRDLIATCHQYSEIGADLLEAAHSTESVDLRPNVSGDASEPIAGPSAE